ncbi:LacI family transcriptional regulator [Neorhodopirellula lusitana]|uniref:LacI family transcriptional regulator n=1 Tax=Neorhodopirellula lusitana TaxID=445327 RepID=A0ABY1PU70_9BACT|nr:DNA-binding transcriptional regulator [Neorhodopirellula lusitana]SMP46346.1 LacI family transcriptional regulator [Neorhodopirellula lusitana]
MQPLSKKPQVLLFIESSRAYGRGCLQGVAGYLRAHGSWDVIHLERGLSEAVPSDLVGRRFDGVIARSENGSIAKGIQQLARWVVDLRGSFSPERGALIDTDPEACARLAIDHFVERGFRRIVYCGYRGVDFSDARGDAFMRYCAEEKLETNRFEMTLGQSHNPAIPIEGVLKHEAHAEILETALVNWLQQQPLPTAVFACNDVCGRQVVRAAMKLGYRVPEQIAVLGVDNDEVICDLTNPPLSSIEPDTYRIGFEGAAYLASLFARELGAVGDDDHRDAANKPDCRKIMIPPRRVVARFSTDILAVNDPELSSAIEFIRLEACNGIGVADVAKHVAISRATLERRFRSVLDHTPREEIERVRLERVKTLLLQTDYGLDRIASMTAYSKAPHLITAFRRQTGLTPTVFRKRHRRF